MKNEIRVAAIVFFFTFLSNGIFCQDEAIDVLILHDQALPEWKHYPKLYEEKRAKIDSLNVFLNNDKQRFVGDMITVMEYLQQNKLDSAMYMCYWQFYNGRRLDDNDLIMLHRQIAYIYQEVGDFLISKKHTLEALRIAERNKYELQSISADLAGIYIGSGDHDSAVYYLKKSLKNTIDPFGVYMNLATVYLKSPELYNVDSAKYYNDEAHKLYSECTCNNDLTHIYIVFGELKRIEGDIDSAIYYFKGVLDETTSNMDWHPYLEANIQLVDIYKELGMYDSSTYYMKNFFLCPCLEHGEKSMINTIKYEYFREVGNDSLAEKYLYASIENRDSLIIDLEQDIHDLSKLNVSQFAVIEENLQVKEENFKAIKARNIAYAIVVILMTGIIVFLMVYFFRKLQRKRELLYLTRMQSIQKIENFKIKEERLKLDLENKNIDLSKLASNLALKRSFFTGHRDKLRELVSLDAGDLKQQLKKYIVELNARESIDKNINALQSDIDRVNNKLTVGLKERFPELTDNDVQVCILHLLRLSTKEIAVIRGVTPKSIQVARYRIKKKMNLSKEEEIVHFIEKNILN